ncbi:phospholipase D-like domain-containing protein [Neobacillus drentensis]|uniref:phospholipase D-like domain-containing protein n=1 Tax=Neobacillus drentensis TaxID=220684 RepID=UPI00300396E3
MDNVLLSKFYLLLNEIEAELKSYEMTDMELYSSIIEGRKNSMSKDFPLLLTLFPSLSKEELGNLLVLIKLLNTKYRQDKVDIVGTLPITVPSIRKTVGVVRQLLNEAKSHILITGYAITEYFTDIFDLVLAKNSNGVQVDLYVDDNQRVTQFLNQIKNKDHQLNIYTYQGKDFSALHAKVLTIDYQKAFVSSANLSYNGIVNNLELGTLITGKKVTALTQIFEELNTQGYFRKL